MATAAEAVMPVSSGARTSKTTAKIMDAIAIVTAATVWGRGLRMMGCWLAGFCSGARSLSDKAILQMARDFVKFSVTACRR